MFMLSRTIGVPFLVYFVSTAYKGMRWNESMRELIEREKTRNQKTQILIEAKQDQSVHPLPLFVLLD